MEDEEDSNADTDSQEAEEEGISLRLSEYFHVWYLIPALAFIVILVLLRRTILLKRAAEYQVRQSFGYLILILHACGKMKSFHGAEADFADILKTTVPVLKNEEIRSMMAAVNAAAYGDKAPSEEENVLLKRQYGSSMRPQIRSKNFCFGSGIHFYKIFRRRFCINML